MEVNNKTALKIAQLHDHFIQEGVRLCCVVGAPCSGKGYALDRLRPVLDRSGFSIISMSGVLREVSFSQALQEEVGVDSARRIATAMKTGDLVPDEDVVVALFSKINQIFSQSRRRVFVLDGYPRTTVQATTANGTVHRLVRLHISSKLLERNQQRRIEEGLRSDDTPEIIQRRIRMFEETIGGVVDSFKPEIIRETNPSSDGYDRVADVVRALLIPATVQHRILQDLRAQSWD